MKLNPTLVDLPDIRAESLQLSIMGDGGVLPEYSAHGRTWVVGEAGARFRVRVRHDGARPWLVRCLIDGVEAEPEVDLSLLPRGHPAHVAEEFYSGWLVRGALRSFRRREVEHREARRLLHVKARVKHGCAHRLRHSR